MILTSSFLFLKRIYLVLDAFKVSLFALNQSSILESSKFAKSYKSCKLLEESCCSVVSSKKRIVKNFDALRSLIRIRNKIGPNIDPYGTPQEISLSEESTLGFPFFRKKISILEMELSGNLLRKPEFRDNSGINGNRKFSGLFLFYGMETVKFPVSIS